MRDGAFEGFDCWKGASLFVFYDFGRCISAEIGILGWLRWILPYHYLFTACTRPDGGDTIVLALVTIFFFLSLHGAAY